MNRKDMLAIVSVALIVFALLLNIKVAGGFALGDYLLITAGLPTMTNGDNGFDIMGLITVASLILGIVLFRQYFRKYRTRCGEALLFGVIAFMILYQPVYNTTYAIIKSQYNGLNAIEYNKAESTCSYSITPSNDYIECQCTLKFINYSHKTQDFQVEPGLVKEQIKEGLQKQFNINVTDLGYDEKHFVSLPPASFGISRNPTMTLEQFKFRFQNKENVGNVAGRGFIRSPDITLLSMNKP